MGIGNKKNSEKIMGCLGIWFPYFLTELVKKWKNQQLFLLKINFLQINCRPEQQSTHIESRKYSFDGLQLKSKFNLVENNHLIKIL
jgi:hypothetical protein